MKHRTTLSATLVAATALLLSHQPVGAAVDPPSPASGHAAVIAQGVITFNDGPFNWQVASLAATADPTDVDTTAPSFIVTDGPAALVVSGAVGAVARLAPGEALFAPAAEPTQVGTLLPAGGTGMTIRIAGGAGDPTATFTPGAAARDVDLLRDVLATNEAVIVHTDVSAFVVVTAGAVTAAGMTIAPGAPATLTGDITLINTSPQTATVLVAVVGPALGDVADPQPAPAPAPQTPVTNAPATPAPTTPTPGTDAPAETAPETAPETEPEPEPEPQPEPDPNADTDGDGLTDAQEDGLGTSAIDPDTDNDGLSDGTEVGAGCNPNSHDSDGDGFADGQPGECGGPAGVR